MHVWMVLGGWTDEQYFHLKLPSSIQYMFSDINQIELFAILVSLRVWGDKWAWRNIIFGCDNDNAVRALNSGASRDQVVQKILKNIHWQCVHNNMMCKATFIASHRSFIMDSLLRFHLHAHFCSLFAKYNQDLGLKRVMIQHKMLNLVDF